MSLLYLPGRNETHGSCRLQGVTTMHSYTGVVIVEIVTQERRKMWSLAS